MYNKKAHGVVIEIFSGTKELYVTLITSSGAPSKNIYFLEFFFLISIEYFFPYEMFI